jgi:hypothetical protein
MRGILTLTIVVFVAACGGTSAQAPGPGATGIAQGTLACRLPVYRYVGGAASDAFITYPNRSLMDAPGHGTFYDAAVSRWLPYFGNQVSPDGRRYAYTEGFSANPPTATRVHVVDAATDQDVRVVSMPDTQPYFVLDYVAAGVDLGIGFEGRGPGVWRLDVATGQITKVSSDLYPPDAVWRGAVDSRDPSPVRSQMTGTPEYNRIDRRAADGTTTTWFYLPGVGLRWIPFAGDSALLVEAQGSGGFEYWLVTAPGQGRKIASASDQAYAALADGFGRGVVDSHGVWIGSQVSLYLVTNTGSILTEYDREAYPAAACV